MLAALLSSFGTDYLFIYHTVLELACIFIALSVFFSVWFTSHNNSTDNFLLGFGYLFVAIFNIFHAFYFLNAGPSLNSMDLSTRFWILGRITESYVLFFFTQNFYIKAKRWPVLIFSITVSFIISFCAITLQDFIPALHTDNGVTPIKTTLEVIIIFVYLITLFYIKANSLNKKHPKVTYKFISISILLSIFSEFCFLKYSSVNSSIWVTGHLFKVISYFFLFRGTFVNTVIYPYRMLEVENKKLNKAYEKLDIAHRDKAYAIKTLNDILDALPVAVLTCDSDNRLKFANRKFEEMLECDKYELYDKTVDETIETYTTTGGKNIKLSVSSHEICNGKLILFNDAKKEQELENIHLQTQTILNAVSNLILMIDNNKKVVLCNEALEEVLEMDRNKIIGMDIDDLNQLVNFEGQGIPEMISCKQNDKQIYEAAITTLKNNKKILGLHLSPINNVYGERIGAICVGNDITNLKKEHQKMIQQEKLALLGQMGAGIVHETRNYLTTIKGRCQLIERLPPNDDIKKHAKKISNNIDEINRIISEFLFLSKPRESELVKVSMYDILNSIKGMVEASSLVKGVDVAFQLFKEDRILLCDEAQIKQVILNICKNAVDAMSEKSNAKLNIETGFIEQTFEMFIKISDNGYGISHEDLKKIGTPFFTTKKTGTGLGISMCQEIIKGHNGKLKVESELGIGTTFTILLPCIQEAASEEPA